MPPRDESPQNQPFPQQGPQPPAPDYGASQPGSPTAQPQNFGVPVPQSQPPVQTYMPSDQLPSPDPTLIPTPMPSAMPSVQPVVPPRPVENYPDHMYYPVTPKKKGSKILVALAVLLSVTALLGGAGYAYMNSRPTPEKVFAAAVDDSLSTTHVKQSLEMKSAGTINLMYDFSRQADPRVYTASKATIFGLDFDLRQYSSLKNSYVSYQKYGPLFDTAGSLQDYKNKWMQNRKDGQPVVKDSFGDVFFPDAYYQLFGDWIFGNFSAADKKALSNLIVDQKAFEYDPAKVEKKTIDGREHYVYDVKYDTEKRKAINRRAAEIWKLDYQDLKDRLDLGAGTQKAKLYVDIASKHLVRVDAESAGENATIKYTDYNKASIPDEPSPQADYAKFYELADKSGAGVF